MLAAGCHTRALSLSVFTHLCSLLDSDVNMSWLTNYCEFICKDLWLIWGFSQHGFAVWPPSIYCHFSNPHSLCLAKEENRECEKQREWMKTWNIYQCGAVCLNICFHFGVFFQLCARESGAPKCGEGCFQVVLWHTSFFFLLSSSSILVGRLSLAKTVLSALRKDALVQKLCIVGSKDL